MIYCWGKWQQTIICCMRSDIYPQVNEKILKELLFQKNHSKDSTAYIFKIILIQ